MQSLTEYYPIVAQFLLSNVLFCLIASIDRFKSNHWNATESKREYNGDQWLNSIGVFTVSQFNPCKEFVVFKQNIKTNYQNIYKKIY